jgi:hypothetical protein
MSNQDPAVFPAGVVTLHQWTMMPDGSTYMHLWAPAWRVITDKATGIPFFRSAEHWHIAAFGPDGRLLILIPGCQVKGFATCSVNPQLKGGAQIYTAE